MPALYNGTAIFKYLYLNGIKCIRNKTRLLVIVLTDYDTVQVMRRIRTHVEEFDEVLMKKTSE